jgi:hypothetical protein
MNKTTFMALQLTVDGVVAAPAPALTELLNAHLVFTVDVIEAADAIIQIASIACLSSSAVPAVEISTVALNRLREALDTLSDYDESWQPVLETGCELIADIACRQCKRH